jgi:hypothetical protein
MRNVEEYLLQHLFVLFVLGDILKNAVPNHGAIGLRLRGGIYAMLMDAAV